MALSEGSPYKDSEATPSIGSAQSRRALPMALLSLILTNAAACNKSGDDTAEDTGAASAPLDTESLDTAGSTDARDTGEACVLQEWYGDADKDGFGDAGDVQRACEQPAGYVPDAEDCNSDDGTVYPGAPELCGDGVPNNCSVTPAAAKEACRPESGSLNARHYPRVEFLDGVSITRVVPINNEMALVLREDGKLYRVDFSGEDDSTTIRVANPDDLPEGIEELSPGPEKNIMDIAQDGDVLYILFEKEGAGPGGSTSLELEEHRLSDLVGDKATLYQFQI